MTNALARLRDTQRALEAQARVELAMARTVAECTGYRPEYVAARNASAQKLQKAAELVKQARELFE